MVVRVVAFAADEVKIAGQLYLPVTPVHLYTLRFASVTVSRTVPLT